MKKKIIKQADKCELLSYINSMIVNSRKNSTKPRLRGLLFRLRQFSNERQIRLYSDSFTYTMIDEFVYFLRKCTLLKGDKTKHYRHNNVCNFMRTLKNVLNALVRDSYNVNMSYKEYSMKTEEIQAVYLTDEELNRLSSLKLRTPKAAATRDRFLLGCYIAQRYSDYSRISVDQNFDFKNNEIKIKTVKTGALVVIPIHPQIHAMIKRNNYMLPELNSLVAFNACIKRLCKRAGIVNEVLIEYTEGTTVIRKKIPKYKLISSHTARRTGATLMRLAGMQLHEIMLITGHKTEEACLGYMCISREENAKNLQDHPFFKK